LKFLHIAGKPLDNSNLVKENDRRWLWVSYLRQESELLEGKQKANEENKSVCFGTSREASDAFFFVETRWMMRSWPWPSSSLRAARFWNLGWIEPKTG